jgi:hypothetical protein
MFANKRHHCFISSTQYYDGKRKERRKKKFLLKENDLQPFSGMKGVMFTENLWVCVSVNVCVFSAFAYLSLPFAIEKKSYGKVEQNFKQTSERKRRKVFQKREFSKYNKSHAHFMCFQQLRQLFLRAQ